MKRFFSNPAKPMLAYLVLFAVVFICVCIYGLGTMRAQATSKPAEAPVVQTATKTTITSPTTDTYSLAGYNVRSYVETYGKIYWDGLAWDECNLTGAKRVGDRVYIPGHYYKPDVCNGKKIGADEHFFFIDQLGINGKPIDKPLLFGGAVRQVAVAVSGFRDEHVGPEIPGDICPLDGGHIVE